MYNRLQSADLITECRGKTMTITISDVLELSAVINTPLFSRPHRLTPFGRLLYVG